MKDEMLQDILKNVLYATDMRLSQRGHFAKEIG